METESDARSVPIDLAYTRAPATNPQTLAREGTMPKPTEDKPHVHGPGCDHDHPAQPHRLAEPKPGRNDPCPCGSGKKYKKCHG